MDLHAANRLLGLSRMGGVLVIFVTGWLVDRFGPRTVMLGTGGVVGAATIGVGLFHGTPLVVAVFVQPLLISSFFPAALSGLARIVPREVCNLAVSSIVPFAFLFGGGLVPTGMGALGDRASFSRGFVLLGAAFLTSMALLPFLRIPDSPGRSEPY